MESNFEVHRFDKEIKDEKLKKPKKKIKRFFSFLFKFISFSFLIGFVASVASAYVFYVKIKSDFYLAKPKINATQTVLYDKEGQIIYESFGTKAPERVSLKDLPEHLKQSTLAAEDLEFYNHDAFDVKAILRAVYQNFQKSEEEGIDKFSVLLDQDSYTQGGSTITQQLVKNRYLTNEKSFNRKIKELIYASEMEKRYSKDEILEMYLNEIYYGEQALGIENASKIYFNKKAKDLTLAESTMLAGLPQAPTKYSPVSGDFVESKKRQEYVLQRMYLAKYIDLKTAKEIANEPLSIQGKKDFVKKYPFFVDWVLSELETKFGKDFVNKGGIKVHTTLDQKSQEISEKAVADNLKNFQYRKVSNASVVVLDPKNVEVRAMVGGKDYNESKVNVATSYRQPGSSFKPIVYLTGLENDYTANSKFIDKYVNFGGNPGYAPRNYDGSFRGTVTMRKSLAWSLNIPAVEMLSLLGLDKVIESSKKLGIDLGDDAKNCGLALALGCKEVRLIDLAGAYSAFSDQGKWSKPVGFTKITDNKNEVIYQTKTTKSQAVKKENAYILSHILSDSVTRRTVFGYRNKLEIDRPAAAKTGTTDNYTDSWTMGYTPDLVVGVWMGNNDRTPMNRTSGIEGAAYIWNDVISNITKGTEKKDFERPEDVVEVKVNPYTGLVGTSGQTEVFRKGTVPEGKENLDYLKRF